MYGTTTQGGSSGEGTVFAVNTDSTGFTNLHHFTATSALEVNDDGAYPNAELLLSGQTLYGTASKGGSSGLGTVFALNTNGTGFTILHRFTGGTDGAAPVAGLIPSGTTLYGTTSGGGTGGTGTVFAVKADGAAFTILHTFEPTHRCGSAASRSIEGDCLALVAMPILTPQG